jgi:hypothetical protein
LAGINAVANVFSAVIGGMSYFKSNDGNWYVGNGNGGDGDFVDAGSSNQQIGVSGADGTFVYP